MKTQIINYLELRTRKHLLPILPALFSAAFLIAMEPANPASAAQRPISDFVSRQGKFCVVQDTNGAIDCAASHYTADTTGGGCTLFLPPAADYAGWSDLKGNSASFDYAGLANAALGGALGTTMDGSIDEVAQPDGSVIVRVVLHTSNAMAFAVEGLDFGGPLLFGHRVPEILAGAPVSVGSCKFTVVFRNPAPGAPLPAIEDLFYCRSGDIIFISFEGQSNGLLDNGQPGQLQVIQVGLLGVLAHANSHSRVALDAFPAEHINVKALGN